MATPVCVSCRQSTSSHFSITRYNAQNQSVGSVDVCSITCLLRWGYEYATLEGARLAFGVKNSVTSLLNSLRGSKT
jgi:hypothetical protein